MIRSHIWGLAFLAVALALVFQCYPEGSVTATDTDGTAVSGSIRSYSMDWLSDASGSVVWTSRWMSAVLRRVQLVSDTGATSPDQSYDITLTDPQSFDVLAGYGANVNTAATVNIAPAIMLSDDTVTTAVPIVVDSALVLTIANTGSNGNGTVVLYYEP